MLRLVCLFACVACALGFAPVATPRTALLQQQRAAVCMKTAATKPQRVNKRNYEYNKMYKSEMRTRVKRVRAAWPRCVVVCRPKFSPLMQVLEAVNEGDYEVSVPLLSKAFAILDKNVKRGILHKNTAARKKSQLHLKVKRLEVRATQCVRAMMSQRSSDRCVHTCCSRAGCARRGRGGGPC